MARSTILGESPPVKSLLDMIDRVADTSANILIIGESGTGKELVAREIHTKSSVRDKPFVPINCGAIPENLIESELFGHVKGSFTGAVSDKEGLFQVASGGTLLLDEVGELPLAMQVKLLRVLQERVVRPVGGTKLIKVDARLISATNRDLEKSVAQGTFREDLYYRLNVILLRVPPLRDRGEDSWLLAQYFLKKFANGQSLSFSPSVKKAILSYSWPGNVRELENVVERAVALTHSGEIGSDALPVAMATALALASENQSGPSSSPIVLPSRDQGPFDLQKTLDEVEKYYLELALEKTGGTKNKAADYLGMTFRSLRYRLKKFGLE